MSLNPPSVYPCAIRCRRVFYSFYATERKAWGWLAASGLDGADKREGYKSRQPLFELPGNAGRLMRCRCCAQVLVDPLSEAVGYGPECRAGKCNCKRNAGLADERVNLLRHLHLCYDPHLLLRSVACYRPHQPPYCLKIIGRYSRCGVDVGVLVGVAVAVVVGVGVLVGVAVLVGVEVSVLVGVAVCVGVGVPVALGVAVAVGVGVTVGVSVAVLVGVTVGVAVCVGVGVPVALGVAVGVGVTVGVSVGVGVGVSVVIEVAVYTPPACICAIFKLSTLDIISVSIRSKSKTLPANGRFARKLMVATGVSYSATYPVVSEFNIAKLTVTLPESASTSFTDADQPLVKSSWLSCIWIPSLFGSASSISRSGIEPS